MDRQLLISAGPGEWRAALLEQGVPVELHVERGDYAEAASIHLGRVVRLLPALGAALVDIGADRPAFLPQREMVPRGRRLHEGQRLIVQILREAQAGKPARLTTAITLRGRLLELRLGRRGLVGGEALSDAQRGQLLTVVESAAGTGAAPHPPAARVPPSPHLRGEARGEGEGGAGLRIREVAPAETLAKEAAKLARRWRDIADRAASLEPPARLDPEALFAVTLAGSLATAPDEILTDDPAAIPEIRAAFPGIAIVHLTETEWPIDMDAAFEEALSDTLTLANGGSVHFTATPAGVLVDVDTGTPETGSPERTGLAANLAAATAIARQMRLRNLAGAIIVDFVGLESRAARDKVRAALAEALAPDPASPQLLGWTRLGHFELVRPRRRRPLAETLLELRPGGPLVKSAITVSHEALRALRRAARAQPGRRWRLTVAPDVAAALAGPLAHAARQAKERFARSLAIEADPSYDRERFQISAL